MLTVAPKRESEATLARMRKLLPGVINCLRAVIPEVRVQSRLHSSLRVVCAGDAGMQLTLLGLLQLPATSHPRMVYCSACCAYDPHWILKPGRIDEAFLKAAIKVPFMPAPPRQCTVCCMAP